MRLKKRALTCFVAAVFVLLMAFSGCGKTVDCGADRPQDMTDQEFTVYNTVSVDALGRETDAVTGFREEKYVGLFYFPWLDVSKKQDTIYNVSEILAIDPQALWSTDSADSPVGKDHIWGEPLYGFYNSDDEWVMRRHVEIWISLGVDFLFFDCTNGFTYDNVWQKLLPILEYYNKAGWNAPQVTFYTNAKSADTIAHLYNNLYAENYCPTTWFSPNGKPMIIGAQVDTDQTGVGSSVDNLPQEVRDFFDIKYSIWPTTTETEQEDGLPWMCWKYPQVVHPGTDGLNAISVSVSEHAAAPFSTSLYYKGTDEAAYNSNWGRGFDFETMTNSDARVAEGSNFEQQWQTAIDMRDEIDIVMTTSWNEWIVGKGAWNFPPYVSFIDTVNQEFSRDIEMMRGGHQDNYVMQFGRNLRDFKKLESSDAEYRRLKIDRPEQFGLYLSDEKWGNYGHKYLDLRRDAMERNALDITGRNYLTDYSNRNDIIAARAVHDGGYLYFMVETAAAIIPYAQGTNWMNIHIGTGEGSSWEGFNFVLNRYPTGSGKTSLERHAGDGYTWKKVCDVEYRVSGNRMIFAVPLSRLGLKADDLCIDFKVSDNVTIPDDIMEYYVSGDSAPIGRFAYRYDYSN